MDSIFIKSITLKKQMYNSFKDTLRAKYSYMKSPNLTFSVFKSWSLMAMILGIFTSYGDTTSSPLFLKCLEKGYLPNLNEIENDNNVRICICIEEKKLNGRSKNK